MNHLVTQEAANSTPSYAQRRAAMADETRTRILDACVAILARGVAELSVPAVAREAGVSVPTVYRNFADKKTLIDETVHHLRKLRGNYSVPSALEELPEVIRKNFETAASVNEVVAAALNSEPILSMRRDSGQRMATMTTMLEPHLAEASALDRENSILIATVLCSSNTLRAFRDLTGVSPRRAADAVSWAIARLAGVPSLSPEPSRRTKTRKSKGKAR